MNQYLFLRRMRGPIILLTFGITAILDEYSGIGYGRSWPLYIIVWGLLKLAENAILAQNPPAGYPGYPGYPAAPGAATYTSGMPTEYTGTVPVDASGSTAVVPPQGSPTQDEEGR